MADMKAALQNTATLLNSTDTSSKPGIAPVRAVWKAFTEGSLPCHRCGWFSRFEDGDF